jgi:hypothetical protein
VGLPLRKVASVPWMPAGTVLSVLLVKKTQSRQNIRPRFTVQRIMFRPLLAQPRLPLAWKSSKSHRPDPCLPRPP